MTLNPSEDHFLHNAQELNSEDYAKQWGKRGEELISKVKERGFATIEEIPGSDKGGIRMVDAPLPEDWKSIQITPIFVENVFARWVYDPNRIEVTTQMWGPDNIPPGKTAQQVDEEITKDGFQFLDGNIARTIYFKTITEENKVKIDKEIRVPQVSRKTADEVIEEFKNNWAKATDRYWSELGDKNILLGGTLSMAIDLGLVGDPYEMALGFAAVYAALESQAEKENLQLPRVSSDGVKVVLAELERKTTESIAKGQPIIFEDFIHGIGEEDPELGRVVEECSRLITSANKESFGMGAEITLRALEHAAKSHKLQKIYGI